MENMSESVVEEAVRAMLIKHAPDDARPAAYAAGLCLVAPNAVLATLPLNFTCTPQAVEMGERFTQRKQHARRLQFVREKPR